MGRGQHGHSLVETIAVLILMGVLAAAAVPSLSGMRAVDEARFIHEVRAALRHAQRSAVAQRRTVCVAFTSASVALSIASTAGGPCVVGLPGPGGESALTVSAEGLGFASLPSDFAFDALGAASVGQTLQFADAAIVVEAGTGYVH